MTEWQPIETAPGDRTIIVGDLLVETVAVTHYFDGWVLGTQGIRNPERLEFEPVWWLPYDFKRNPFKTPIPR